MTESELAAIRERVEKATKGPWVAACEDHGDLGIERWVTIPTGAAFSDGPSDDDKGWDWTLGHYNQKNGEADAAFIAHAREDIPALLDEIERLRGS